MNYSLFCSAAREQEETADVLTDCGKNHKLLIKIYENTLAYGRGTCYNQNIFVG